MDYKIEELEIMLSETKAKLLSEEKKLSKAKENMGKYLDRIKIIEELIQDCEG